MDQSNNPQGVFINGKAQIIEMLEHMSDGEKQRLIHNIRIKNPTLANELMEKSFSFNDLSRAQDADLKKIINSTNSQVLGLALKYSPAEFQRRLLSLASR